MDIAVGNLSNLTNSNVRRGEDESDYPLLRKLLQCIASQFDESGKEYTIDDLASGVKLCNLISDYIEEVKMQDYHSSISSNPYWADDNLIIFGRACQQIQVPRTCIASSNDFKDRNFSKIELMLVIVIVRCLAYTSQLKVDDETLQLIRDYKLGQYPEKERDRRICENILDVFRNKNNDKSVPVNESSDSEDDLPKERSPIQSTQTTSVSEEKQPDDMQSIELSMSKESESKPEGGEPKTQDDEVDEVNSQENLPEPEESGVNFERRKPSSDEEKGSSVPEQSKSEASDGEVDEVTSQENLPTPEEEKASNSIEPTPISDGDAEVDEVTEDNPRRGSKPKEPSMLPEPKAAISEGESDVDDVDKPSIFATTTVAGGNENAPKSAVVGSPDNAEENVPEPIESESEHEPDQDVVQITNDPPELNPEEIGVIPSEIPEDEPTKVKPNSIQNTTQPVVVPELNKKEDAIKKMQSIKPHEIKWYIVTLFILLMVICLAGMITCGVWLAKLH